MWTLSAFADEISPELDQQLQTLAGESIRHLEFRGVWKKNVLDLSNPEIETVKAALARGGVTVSSIGSPIGKIPIGEDFAPHLARFQRAIQVAHALEAPFIRIFSFFMPAGQDPARHQQCEWREHGQEVAGIRERVYVRGDDAEHERNPHAGQQPGVAPCAIPVGAPSSGSSSPIVSMPYGRSCPPMRTSSSGPTPAVLDGSFNTRSSIGPEHAIYVIFGC